MAAAVIKKRFTADEYQRMGQVGILSDTTIASSSSTARSSR